MTTIKLREEFENQQNKKKESRETIKKKLSKIEENGENEEKIDIIPPHPKIYYSCYVFNEEIDYNQKTKKEGEFATIKLNTQKALVISSFYQFHAEFFEIMKGIKKWVQSLAGLDLEKVIHSLVFDIPSPCPGMTRVKYNYSQFIEFQFELNSINKIPKAGSDLKVIFDVLGIRNVLEILNYVVLEVPVIVFCVDKYILANTVKSLEEFIFPFSYPYSVIEILPKVYYKSLEKLSCFIVGINQKYTNGFFEDNNIRIEDRNYLIVTLSEQEPHYTFHRKSPDKYGIILKDFNKVIKKEGEDSQKLLNVLKEITFPKHYLSKIMKNLNQLFHDKNGIKNNINDIENDDIRFKFYYFFISMLQHYKNFLINDKTKLIELYSKVESDSIELNDLFKFQDFIRSDDSFEFFNQFMLTRIWKNFLIKNLYPSTIEDKLDVILMDEIITKKKNKNMIKQLFKENTPFLETLLFDIKKTELISISDSNELLFNDSAQNNTQDQLLLLNNDKLNLLYQYYLESNQKVKNLYAEFYDTCQCILKERRFSEKYTSIGYNINIYKELKPNNENYVIKLRILLICYTFKDLDKGEKWVMFNELLKEIQNILNFERKKSIIDSFLANVMFTTFIKYGDKNMCSLLYKELLVIPCVKDNYLIFTQLHKKFINRKDEFKLPLPKETILKERNYNLFDSQENKLCMKIILICGCKNCKLPLDMVPTITTYSSTNYNEISFKCLVCHTKITARFSVSILSLNNQTKDKTYILYTPKALFNFIKSIGDFNVNTFYKEHPAVFFNLMILFQTHGNNYSFLFPYKEKNYIGFNPKNLEIEKTDDKKYVNKRVSLGANKWYEKCDFPENRYRQKRYTKLLSSKKTAGDFKTFEALNPTSFFQKDFSKKQKKKFNSALKRAKTLNEY